MNEEERPWQPLHKAAQSGDVAAATRALDADAAVDPFASVLTDDLTPLQLAVKNSYPAVATLLLGRGADVNLASDVQGWTPLFFAAMASGRSSAGV